MLMQECVHVQWLEGCSVPLDLHHEVVDVDQLSTNGQALEGRLRENLLETMVVLNQLRECTLRGEERGGRGEGGGRERGGRMIM